VNIVVLRVMTLTIVFITSNFVPTNLPLNMMVKAKEDMGDTILFNLKEKSNVKPQVKP
jgi:hypothetical protein